ncbi:MAG: hypothetical protein WCS94_23405 [Verrucomicrobiota bacterium]
MKTKICLIALLTALNVPAWAALYSYGTLTSGGGGSSLGVISDNNWIGTTTLPNTSFTAGGLGASITELTLTLQLTGGSVSDVTAAYLRLGTGTGPNGGFYDLTGLLTANSGNIVSGTSFSIDFSTSGLQSAFNGINPNGTWTLFFADTVPGDTTTLNGWSLDITAVPEPVNVAMAIFGVGMVGVAAIRRYLNHKKTTPKP